MPDADGAGKLTDAGPAEAIALRPEAAGPCRPGGGQRPQDPPTGEHTRRGRSLPARRRISAHQMTS
jgi:hypothetical protein